MLEYLVNYTKPLEIFDQKNIKIKITLVKTKLMYTIQDYGVKEKISMEDSDINNYKKVLFDIKCNFKIVVWFYNKLSIELRRYINQYDSSILDAIIDFKYNGRTTSRMHQLYGFGTNQNPSVLGVFGFKSLPVWNIPSVTNLLESNISTITNEFLILKQKSTDYESLKASCTSKRNNNFVGGWKVYHLMEEGLRNENNLLYCPTVSKILASLNICACSLGYAYFSILSANISIDPHYGVTNTKLRIQIPLLNQLNINKCYITINNKEYQYKDGKAIIFDDSYLHSVRNDSIQDRVVLVIDIWHPDLSRYEIKALSNYFYNGCGLSTNDLSQNQPDYFSYIPLNKVDPFYKVLIIGPKEVGKSRLIRRYVFDEFNNYQPNFRENDLLYKKN